MIFVLLVSVLLRTPYLPYLVGGISGRGGIEMVSASKPSANEPAKDLILVHTVQLKPMIKALISERMVSCGISDVVFASIYSEKTRLKKLMKIIIIIMNISQETTVFHWHQKLTSAMKLRPEK